MTDRPTFAELQSWSLCELARANISTSHHDVQLLLMAAGGLDKAGLIGQAQKPCPVATIKTFKSHVRRRLNHEPVYRILGKREFHGLQLELNEATLEPRDDTECLVEAVLRNIPDRNLEMRFLDLGTGTGAIALALLCELPVSTGVAVDIDPRTLLAATNNAKANHLQNRFLSLCSNWFEEVSGDFDFIVSNPPYIASSIVQELDLEVRRFDPDIALDGGEDGLMAYRTILASAQAYLRPGGFLGLEIGHDQKESVQQLARKTAWSDIQSFQDLAGRDRAMIMRCNL